MMSTAKAPQMRFPLGQSEGGHAKFVVDQPMKIREDMLFMKKPEVWPLVAAIAFAGIIGTWKIATLDMEPSQGPIKAFFGANNREILGIKPSDSKLEYKKDA
ncbi:Hypothetical Protein FCC1311_100192 [Hondaea fermentalgiana]|uniref:Uncharacterized protein n=1 Tax=Hondaea fermentalgiana TaxID=2315210 RepID=A0A2R5GSE0_9STRA|nr:Hypothetical Protein FCC1311_100192 [Hondaea fermentalgiana]|eukprot:GBG33796.1 Hypothetical Protein FCC1311_100192 [Hondaea fermentalgiana]